MTRNRVISHSSAALVLSLALSIVPAIRLHAQTAAPATHADSKFIQLTLISKLDSKSAKVGDPVVAKTEGKAEANGLTIPSGSKLIGKITAATHEPASITFEFDSLERKNQPATPIQATVVAAAPEPPDVVKPFSSSKGEYVNSNPGSDDPSTLSSPGSRIKNVTLTAGTFSSNKDFKLPNGSLLGVTLSPATK